MFEKIEDGGLSYINMKAKVYDDLKSFAFNGQFY